MGVLVLLQDVREMAENFNKKRKAGQVQGHGSGYGGSGFKFDAWEENQIKAAKKVGLPGGGGHGGVGKSCVMMGVGLLVVVGMSRELGDAKVPGGSPSSGGGSHAYEPAQLLAGKKLGIRAEVQPGSLGLFFLCSLEKLLA